MHTNSTGQWGSGGGDVVVIYIYNMAADLCAHGCRLEHCGTYRLANVYTYIYYCTHTVTIIHIRDIHYIYLYVCEYAHAL